jgi:hypothetical protein
MRQRSRILFDAAAGIALPPQQRRVGTVAGVSLALFALFSGPANGEVHQGPVAASPSCRSRSRACWSDAPCARDTDPRSSVAPSWSPALPRAWRSACTRRAFRTTRSSERARSSRSGRRLRRDSPPHGSGRASRRAPSPRGAAPRRPRAHRVGAPLRARLLVSLRQAKPGEGGRGCRPSLGNLSVGPCG